MLSTVIIICRCETFSQYKVRVTKQLGILKFYLHPTSISFYLLHPAVYFSFVVLVVPAGCLSVVKRHDGDSTFLRFLFHFNIAGGKIIRFFCSFLTIVPFHSYRRQRGVALLLCISHCNHASSSFHLFSLTKHVIAGIYATIVANVAKLAFVACMHNFTPFSCKQENFPPRNL